MKYTPDGGHVTLRCGQDPTGGAGQAWVEVEDNGPGIPAGERERVLQRFYRLPGVGGEGNGLGLAIADEIARAHHTQLQFDTGPDGLGLRVRVAFTAVPASGAGPGRPCARMKQRMTNRWLLPRASQAGDAHPRGTDRP